MFDGQYKDVYLPRDIKCSQGSYHGYAPCMPAQTNSIQQQQPNRKQNKQQKQCIKERCKVMFYESFPYTKKKHTNETGMYESQIEYLIQYTVLA